MTMTAPPLGHITYIYGFIFTSTRPKAAKYGRRGGTGMHLLYFANSTDVTSYESRDKQLEYTTLFPLLKKLLPPDLAE